jgi:hypothetical protein
MKYKKDWYKSEERFCALWEREIVDRCCISVLSPKEDGIKWNQKKDYPDNIEDRIKFWTDGEWILRRHLDWFENTCFIGEAFPQIWLNLGASGHAGYFKGVKYQFEDTVWFHPIIKDWETGVPDFEPEGFLYKKTLELAEFLVKESKKEFFVSMPDTSGNIDVLAHLRGSGNLLMDMIVESDAIKSAMQKVQKVWEQTNETVYNIIKDNNGGGSTIGWMDTWAPGKHAQMQSDLSVMISPEMYDEFIIPELKNQLNWLEYSTYHLDGVEQIRHLDKLLKLEKLDMIQWTPVVGQNSPVNYLPVLKKIQQAGKILHLNLTKNEIEPVMKELSSKGLYIRTIASGKEEANYIIKKVEKWTHE